MIFRKIAYLILAAMAILLPACSDEISMVKPGPSVPVIYAVFDIRDSNHYVKLSRTFAGDEDVRTLLTDPDLVFYPDAEVFLTDPSGRSRINFIEVHDIPRDSGFFPALPNKTYFYAGALNAGSRSLKVVLPSDGDTLAASFSFLDNFRIITPRAGFKRFYFYEDPMIFSWYLNPGAGLFELTLSLRYLEMYTSGESEIFTVRFHRQIKPEVLEIEQDHYNYRFYSEPFFAFLGTKIRSDSRIDYRKPLSLDMEISAADTTLSRYLSWFGLEIDEKINPNGNIQGAIGVVASKYTIHYPGLIFSPRAQDSLVRGRFTGNRGFVANSEWQ